MTEHDCSVLSNNYSRTIIILQSEDKYIYVLYSTMFHPNINYLSSPLQIINNKHRLVGVAPTRRTLFLSTEKERDEKKTTISIV